MSSPNSSPSNHQISMKPWPPPPDLDSIQELVATADVDGFIADGAPADEYETEAEALFEHIQHFATAELVQSRLMPLLEGIWQRSFNLSADALAERRPGLLQLAGQIERFFGPAAQPQVRGA